MSKRVLIAGFKHETNTFSILPTDLAAYRARGFHRGEDIAAAYAGTNTEIAAFLEGCKKYGWEPILTIAADATPSGKLTRDTYEAIAGEIVDTAAKAGRLDALLLNLHGAMVAEHTFDGEGTLLERLRAKLGSDILIAATLDLHANVTEAMAQHADILVSYRTYPHIDMYDIGTEVVDLVARTLDGRIRPKTYLARHPLITGVDEGRTTSPGPMLEILEKASALKRERGVLAASINAGFPWADIPEVGPTAVIVGDGDDSRFAEMAQGLSQYIWETRHRTTVQHVSVAEAVARAKAKGKPGAPVVLADFADNPGGGGYCDTTGLLRGMIEGGLENAALAALYDPESAEACHRAGVGASIALKIGGKVDPAYGNPIEVTAKITHLSDGKFRIEGPMLRGFAVDMGPTATVKVGGVEVVLASRRFQNYDRNFFRVGGIEPSERSVLAVKSMQHFRAAYAPIASEIIVVDEGGGITSHDLRKLTFRHVRRPVWPLDLE
jgi:microcystin degradation protein MlrC